MSIKQFFSKDPAWAFFLIFASASFISTPIARVALILTIISVVVSEVAAKREKRPGRLRLTLPTIGWIGYFTVAIIVSAIMASTINDELLVSAKGFKKLTKLLYFAGIPFVAVLMNTRERFIQTLKVVVYSAAVFALYTIVSTPLYAWLQTYYPVHEANLAGTPVVGSATGFAAFVQSAAAAVGLDSMLQESLCSKSWLPWGGRPPVSFGGRSGFYYSFVAHGSMDAAQKFMVAVLASVPLIISSESTNKERLKYGALALIIAVGLIVTCKRGPFLATLVVLAIVLLSRIKLWKSLLAVALIVAGIVFITPARERFSTLPDEFNKENGGRALMWTKIAPELHKEYPYGIGFRALTADKMVAIDSRIEPNRTHVHSTPLQAFVDFGYLGLIAWAAWMALTFAAGIKFARSDKSVYSIVPLAAFSALFLFSLVEYNIADSGVVVLYVLVMGATRSEASLAKLKVES